MDKAADSQRLGGGFLGSHFVKCGFISEGDLLQTLSEHFGLPIIELENCHIEKSAIDLVPENLAQRHGLVPILKRDSKLTVAMADPTNMVGLNDVKFITGLDIQIVLASEAEIKAKQEKLYESEVCYDDLLDGLYESTIDLGQSEESFQIAAREKACDDSPAVKIVNAILSDAIKKGASDIHLEPYEKIYRVRFRIDGVLYEIMRPPATLKGAITSRIKIMSELDIAERRLPQDGRIKLRLGPNKEMDFRVNVMPTLFGEKVVLRLLDKSNLQIDLGKLGFEHGQLEDFKKALYKPHGMVLVTGPTGSGKTTTLYSALADLNKLVTNISTAEDPVEFNLDGINQTQIHEEIGFNFAAALRAFLRQDPDVIMVGEIRDYETAEIAIKASLTGHLVLSTLHTNDAPSTINRLLNMGVEPFLVASSVNLIIAQRLARRVCLACSEGLKIKPEVLASIGVPPEEAANIELKYGKGCDKCAGTGYKGRIAVYEVMPLTDELRELILSGASSAELKRKALKLGMLSLRDSALNRLKEGVTTVEEVLRVTAAD